LVGLAVPALRWLYDYAWFIGFVVAGGLYVLVMEKPLVEQRVPLLK
jgi:NCS1 family nucleobase:cation symporter-1